MQHYSRIDDEGQLWANKVKITAWQKEDKALIVVLDDFLFKEELEKEIATEEFFVTDEIPNSVDEKEKLVVSETDGIDIPTELGDNVVYSDEYENEEEFSSNKPNKNCTKVNKTFG